MQRTRFEKRLSNHPELLAELPGFVDIVEKLWGNVGYEGSFGNLLQQVVQEMQSASLIRGPTVPNAILYRWVYHLKDRTKRALQHDEAPATSEYQSLASEIGSVILDGGDLVRYYLSNLANDPAYTPSKRVRDMYELHRERYNALVSGYEQFVQKINATLGTELGFYASLLGSLK